MEILTGTKIPFIRKKWYFISVSLILIAFSFVSFYIKGFNLGIDFRGGVKFVIRFNSPTSERAIRESLAREGFDAIVQQLGESRGERFVVKTRQTDATVEETSSKVKKGLTGAYGEGNFVVEAEETVGPKVGKELNRKGTMAVIYVLLAILVYLAFRFDFSFAPGAVIALVHDVIITLGFISFLGIEFNLSILAAILTIAGYSVNDTIVVFDRIRENAPRITPSTIVGVVEESINATLSRTIITSFTTLLAVVALFLFGGGVIHDFAFTFVVGIIVGTYSSIFIASPIYIFMYRHWPALAVKLGIRKKY